MTTWVPDDRGKLQRPPARLPPDCHTPPLRHQDLMCRQDNEHRANVLINAHANQALTPPLQRIGRQQSVRWGGGAHTHRGQAGRCQARPETAGRRTTHLVGANNETGREPITPVGRWRGARRRRVLSQRPPVRTPRASFPARGSPAIAPWRLRRRVPPNLHGGHPAQFRRSALRVPPCYLNIHRLAPFALRTALPPSLAGRYSCDYYEASVAIGLASRRRSHVRQCYTSERDLGVPFASFNALTGHRSCAPEDYGMLLQFRRRDRRRLQASFRRGTSYPFWRLGFRQSSFRHITRISPARRPVRLGTAASFLACYCPLHLSGLGSAIRSRDISSHLCPLRGRYSTAPRGAAAAKYSNAP